MSSTDSPTPSQVVERYWPYDGPHSADTVAHAAETVAGLVRYMSNATWNPRLLPGPVLYRVLSSLNSVMYGFDQLLGQLNATAATLAGDESMYDDRRDRLASDTVWNVAENLHLAMEALGAPRAQIERAAQLASHLGHDDTSKRGA